MNLTAIKAVGVFALLGYLVLLLPVLRATRRRTNRSFALFFVATLIWQAGVTGVSFSTDPEVALGLYRVTVTLGVALSLLFAQSARVPQRQHTQMDHPVRLLPLWDYSSFGSCWVGRRSSQASLFLLYRVSGCRNSGLSHTGMYCSAISI